MKNFIKNKLKDDLLKHSGILFIASILAGVSNFLFQIFMNHGLSSPEFAALYAMLAVTMIASVPGMTIQTVMAKQVSHLKAKNKMEQLPGIIRNFLTKVSLTAVLVVVLILIFSPAISGYLKIEQVNSIIIVGFIIGLALILPVGYGALQGLEDFGFLGVTMTAFTFLRLILALVFVFIFHMGISGALGSSIFAFAAASILIFITLHKNFKGYDREQITVEKTENFMWICLITFTFAFMLSFIDIILVKHFFGAGEAAQYSAASLLGRAVFYFPWAVSGAMFPKAAFAHTRGEPTKPLLDKSLKYSFWLSVIPAVSFLIAPQFFLSILKAEYSSAAYLLRIFGIILLPFVLLTVFIYYNLAIHNKKIMYVLGAGAIFHLAVLNIFHRSLLQLITALGFSGLVILSAVFLFTPRSYNSAKLKSQKLA